MSGQAGVVEDEDEAAAVDGVDRERESPSSKL